MNELVLLEDLGMIYPTETSKEKRRYGLYKCYCGSEFKASQTNIKRGITKSCGCLKSSSLTERNKKHNLAKHRLYFTWTGMISRCNNLNAVGYENYGGRGIKVCDRWLNIENFIEDMYPAFKEGLTLDRKDNNKGYSKENCRWASKNLQSENSRKIRKTNTSGYRGSSWHKRSKKWRAVITISKKQISLGNFSSPIEAAIAYDKYVIDNNLEHTTNGLYTRHN